MNMNQPTDFIQIVNNIQVSVPSSLHLMTPYVLREQNDWFEDEIKFIRTFIKDGMKIIDIGANYGLYTLSIAKIIGKQGRIWAFEPTTATFACLEQSIRRNNLTNVELIKAGLSDQIKKAKFYTGDNSELNSLSKESVTGNKHETVLLLTLDHCAKKYNWRDIDFIKLDAEGEESNILKKGRTFLTEASPLIMFELKHGDKFNTGLVNRFKALGYESYRLIPGLNILVPFNHQEPFDEYLLNLFCCKKDKAILLESEGIIVRDWKTPECSLNIKKIAEYFMESPFGKFFTRETFENKALPNDYLKILTAYALVNSKSTSAAEKVGYLMTALSSLRLMLENGEQKIERLTTFARIAFDAGERVLGVNILSNVINTHARRLEFEVTEPLLPASARYDGIQPDNSNIKEWLFSSILEQYIIKHAFSSYFTRRQALPQLELLSDLGFMSEDMRRIEQMIKSCF